MTTEIDPIHLQASTANPIQVFQVPHRPPSIQTLRNFHNPGRVWDTTVSHTTGHLIAVPLLLPNRILRTVIPHLGLNPDTVINKNRV